METNSTSNIIKSYQIQKFKKMAVGCVWIIEQNCPICSCLETITPRSINKWAFTTSEAKLSVIWASSSPEIAKIRSQFSSLRETTSMVLLKLLKYCLSAIVCLLHYCPAITLFIFLVDDRLMHLLASRIGMV